MRRRCSNFGSQDLTSVCPETVRSHVAGRARAYRGWQGFAYNYRFAGEAPNAAEEVCGEMEISDANGRCGNSEDSAAPISLSDGGCHPGNGAAEAHRGREERKHQRIVLSRTFSGCTGHAGSADYRIHDANRATLAD